MNEVITESLVATLSEKCKELYETIDNIKAEVKKMDTLITRREVLEVIDRCLGDKE